MTPHNKTTHKSRRRFVSVWGLAALLTLLFVFTLTGCSAFTDNQSFDRASTNHDSDSENREKVKPSDNPSNPSASQSQGTVAVKEGALAPDFEFVAMDGKTKRLSDYKGKVVILNFWATWCGYCIDEMPAMQEISEDYSSVVVLAVNRSDDSAQAKKFAKEYDYSFVWGLDESDTIAELYPSDGIPYSLIIDKNGTIITIFEGSAPDMYPYFKSAVVEAGA